MHYSAIAVYRWDHSGIVVIHFLEIWRILTVKGGSLNRKRKSFLRPRTGISLKVELCSYMYGRRRGQGGSTLLETYNMKGP